MELWLQHLIPTLVHSITSSWYIRFILQVCALFTSNFFSICFAFDENRPSINTPFHPGDSSDQSGFLAVMLLPQILTTVHLGAARSKSMEHAGRCKGLASLHSRLHLAESRCFLDRSTSNRGFSDPEVGEGGQIPTKEIALRLRP